MILCLARTDSSMDFPRLFSENGVFLMLNAWWEDHDFVLKQRATEALTTAFEEIAKTHGMELIQAGFVSRLAAVYQAMEGLAGVASTIEPPWSGPRPFALAEGESWWRRSAGPVSPLTAQRREAYRR
jgi:hypothetical protein